MADITLGVLGLVGTVVACYKGYDRFIAAEHDDRLRRFYQSLEHERREFRGFWEFLELDLEKESCLGYERQPEPTKKKILQLTNEIRLLLEDTEKLATRYMCEKKYNEDGKSRLTFPEMVEAHQATTQIRSITQQSGRDTPHGAKNSLRGNFRWALKDQEKSKELVESLGKFNQHLKSTLSREEQTLQSMGNLALLFSNARSREELRARLNAFDQPTNEETRLWADINNLREAVRAGEPTEPLPSYLKERDFKTTADIGISESGFSRYQIGRLMTQKGLREVVVEFKKLGDDWTHSTKETVKDRARNLMAHLSGHLSMNLKILKSAGVFQKDELFIGLVYFLPRGISVTSKDPNVCSLATLLKTKTSAPRPPYSLTQRVRLAQALTEAILHLHSANWLHKQIRPENIFFGRRGSESPWDITEPMLLGFDMARPDKVDESSYNVTALEKKDRFMDPERHEDARYRAKYDYFALGVCLYCILAWERIEKSESRFQKKVDDGQVMNTPDGWKDFFVPSARDILRFDCGEILVGAVEACLMNDFEFGDGTDNLFSFFQGVVQPIAGCKV
ncbi:hypothetical protein K458DRAFT_433031 [Lentithecium fluviatile CBS 122367]|uniref:Protein kinase domain-containing protein n=1 Tax=Lentithecium fluviatile CBS 122367 TaxID=1168545 RepID=A0A6G1IUU8_9PLEO|nr:hypothetical protein K458DRAFT_433031 [Lentithecium fluviatile CBS 122367]